MSRQAPVLQSASIVPNFVRGCVKCWIHIRPLPLNSATPGGFTVDPDTDLKAKCPGCQLTPQATFILWTDTATKLMRAYPNALKLENRIAEIQSFIPHSDHYDIACLPQASGALVPPFSIPRRQIKWGEPSIGSSIFVHSPNSASPPDYYILECVYSSLHCTLIHYRITDHADSLFHVTPHH
jgi:hypothetical protein